LRFVLFLICWKLGLKNKEPRRLESLKAWSDRTLGVTTTQALLSPGCLGIFGVGAEQLSGKLIYQYFFSKRKKRYGSLRGSVAPPQGMGQWITALEKYLQQKGVQLTYNCSELDANWIQDSLVVATDHLSAGKILDYYKDSRAPILKNIPTVDLVSVNVFYQQRPSLQKPGFGVLFAREENIVPLGVLFNQDIFDDRSDIHSETWIFGPTNSLSHSADDDYKKQIYLTRQKIWQDKSEPLDLRINRWPRAIPLYGKELEQVLETLMVSQGSLHLVGNYLGEIGLNRLFHRAKKLMESI
jgi:protoporphyrinogen oxidase